MPEPYKIIILWAIMLMPHIVKSQTSVNSIGVPVTENFNSLTTSNSIISWNQNSTLQGWYAYEMDPYSKPIDYSADSGTSTGGRLYSYGRASNSDRALGSLCSGSNDSIFFGWRLKNNTGKAASSISISFTGEQWRRTSGTAANKLSFFYKVASSIASIDSATLRNLTGRGFSYYSNLDFYSPQTGTTTSALNGNDVANSKFLSQTISVAIAAGEEIMLLWLDDDEVGNDQGLAIDNISVTFLNNDITPPAIKMVLYSDTNTVKISFSEPVTKSSATDTANFTFMPYSKILSIIYDSVSQTSLITASLLQGIYYSLTINHLTDLASPPNVQTIKYQIQNLVFNNYNSDKLIMSELFYNDPSAGDNYEFIEITNIGSVPIELGGLKFTSGIDYLFHEYSLLPGKSISIARNKDSCTKVFNMPFLGPFAGEMDNKGEKIDLVNSYSQSIDSLRYKSDWVKETNGQGASIQVKTTHLSSVQNDLFSSWYADNRKEFSFQKGNKIWATPDENPPSLLAIEEIKQSDSNGINKNLSAQVEIRGTVYGINYEPLGLKFVIRDSSSGIVAFSPSKNFGYTVSEGDSIHIVGKVSQNEGLSNIFIDTIKAKNKSKIGLKNPLQVTFPDESHESDLVKITNLQLAQNLKFWPKNNVVKFLRETDTITVFINGETDIDSTEIPFAISFSISGFVFQSSQSPELNDGYFIVPRNLNDIETILPPMVSFAKKDLQFSEKDTAFIELIIRNSNINSTSVTIDKKGGTAKDSLDYISIFPLKITFPENFDTQYGFKIPLINDVFDEPDKTLELVIRNVNNGGKLSSDSSLKITIQDDDNPLYPINFAGKINSFGIPDSNNVKVQIRGIVYGINYRPSGLQFTIRDSSSGIGIFHPGGNFNYEVTEGDEVLVSGTISHFRGLTQLINMDTVLKLNSGISLKSPVEVFKLDEFSESNLVKIKGLRWAQPKPNKWLANSTCKFTNGKDTFQVRIDGDINMAEMAIPSYDTINITGIGGQVSSSSVGPFLDGYLLYPRYNSDIEKYVSETSSVKNLYNFASVFPNPSNGNFELISTKPITTITVISTKGEFIFNSKIPNLLHTSFNLTLLPGIYLLKIVTENGFVYKRIMIK